MLDQAFHQYLENLDHMIYFTDKAEQTRILSERIHWQDSMNCTIYSESDIEAEILTEIAYAFAKTQITTLDA